MAFRALVINPWVTDFKLYDEWMHPVGLYFLMALLARHGADVHYVNCLERLPGQAAVRNGTGRYSCRPFPKPQLYKKILRRYKLYGVGEDDLIHRLNSAPRPDIVFMGSSMTYWLPGLQETARLVRNAFPAAPLVIGGAAARLIPEAVRQACPGAYVYEGSLFDPHAIRTSEIPWLQSLSALTANASLLPAFQLLTHANHGPALASLGCPYRCSYCASGLLHPRYVRRPADDVVRELAFLHRRFGVVNFAWYDDALLHENGAHFLALARGMRRAGLDSLSFHSPNGLNVRWITPAVLDAMKQTGFRTLRFGYESGARIFHRDIGGKTSRGELARKVSLALAAGFAGADMGVYIMSGLPGQTPMQVEEEIEFVASLCVQVKPVFLSPVPRTPLFQRYAEAHPVLGTSPLSQNDSFFITQLPNWDAASVQRIMDLAKSKNAMVRSPAP